MREEAGIVQTRSQMVRGVTIHIVDDNESVSESLSGLLRSCGFATRIFASAEEFLARYDPIESACLILDVMMPGMSGLELQERLLAEGRQLPIVFITARTESSLHAKLLERGAVACLLKPFNEEELLESVRIAAARAVAQRG
ncbi:MAG TPA: response regulator [Polyangiales bacterium]|nr:response regulator [Polyangiales bacterium]